MSRMVMRLERLMSTPYIVAAIFVLVNSTQSIQPPKPQISNRTDEPPVLERTIKKRKKSEVRSRTARAFLLLLTGHNGDTLGRWVRWGRDVPVL